MLFNIIRNIQNLSFEDLMISFITVALVMLVSLPAHELAHAFVAFKLGDNTAKNQGRLSFNPLVHLDPIGSLMLLAVGIGYARPVPVSTYNLKKPRRDLALISLAGPLTNFLLAFIGMGISRLLIHVAPINMVLVNVLTVFDAFIITNISLFVFNLLPIPPLDGFKILSTWLPDKVLRFVSRNEPIIRIVFLVAMFSGILSVPIVELSGFVYNNLVKLFFLRRNFHWS